MSDEPYEVFPSEYIGTRKAAPKKNKGLVILNEGTAEGTIIGGNLCSLNLLQGTEYMPSLKDKILFIEDDDFGGDQSPLEFERNLESLLQLPYAQSIKGVVFGRFPAKTTMTTEKLKYMLSSKLKLAGIPLIAGADFGHTNPMITFPIGGTARIEAKGRMIKIEILKH
jgi:muramoyltetrapeptide carboxypeptidase